MSANEQREAALELASLCLLPRHTHDVAERVDELQRHLRKGPYSRSAKSATKRQAQAEADGEARRRILARLGTRPHPSPACACPQCRPYACACGKCECIQPVAQDGALCPYCGENNHEG